MALTYITLPEVHLVSKTLADIGLVLQTKGENWERFVYQYNALINSELDGESAKTLGILHQSMIDYLSVTIASIETRLADIKPYILPRNTHEALSTPSTSGGYQSRKSC